MSMSKSVLAVALAGVVGAVSSVAFAAGSEVLVERDALKITQQDFADFIEVAVPSSVREEVLGDETSLRKTLAEFYVLKQLNLEARQGGYDRKPEYVKQLDHASSEMLARYYLTEVARKQAPDLEKLAKERYIDRKASFVEPEEVNASHILIAINDERDEAAALKRAKEVLAKAKAGEAFDKLAKEYSDDPSAQSNNGDLGFFVRETMVKPFADAAFALKKKGELSEPVQSQFGYHVIRFNERKAARQLSFEEMKPRLMDEVGSELSKTYIETELNRIRGYDVKINDELLETFLLKKANQ